MTADEIVALLQLVARLQQAVGVLERENAALQAQLADACRS